MEIAELAQRFAGYHDEVKGLAEKMAANEKHWEKIETRLNRQGLDGGGNGPTELRRVGEALRKYIRNGDESGLAEFKAMSVGSDPNGGYSVLPEFSNAITRKIFELSPMRQIARVVPISSGALEEITDLTEADANWVAETQARTETSSPQLGKWSIVAHELCAMPAVSQVLLDDSMLDLGSWLTEKIGQRFARLEGAAFISGNGVGRPRGLATYPTVATSDATRASGVIEHVATGTSGGFGATTNGTDKLLDVVYALKVAYRANARWLMNRQTAAAVRKIKDSQGLYAWNESVVAGQPSTLFGFPVTLDENMPNVGADSLSIAFGDFRAAYTIPDRQGLRLLRDPFSSKPNVLFYCTGRVGGDVTNFESLKFLKFSTS